MTVVLHKGNLPIGADGVPGAADEDVSGGISEYILDATNSNDDGSVVYASATTLTVANYTGGTLIGTQIVEIQRFDSAGQHLETVRAGGEGVVITYSAPTVTVVGAEEDFAATDTFVMFCRGESSRTSVSGVVADRVAVLDSHGNQISVFDLPTSEYKSPKDFTAAYASSSTLTLGSRPASAPIDENAQLVYIRVLNAAGTVATVFVNGFDGVALKLATDTLTITGAGTPFTASDTYEVGYNAQKKAYDSTLTANRSLIVDSDGDQIALFDLPFAEYKSPDDFTAAFATSTTLLLGARPATAPITVDAQIVYIRAVNAAGDACALYVNGYDGVAFELTTNTLTISGAGTPFVTGDSYEVGYNAQVRAYDATLTAYQNKIIDSNGNHISVFSLPSSEYKSPDDFTAAFASNVTITLGARPPTAPINDNAQLVYVRVVDTAGTSSLTFVNGFGGVTLSLATNTLTITGAGTPFATGDAYEVGYNAQKKAYDATTNANRSLIVTTGGVPAAIFFIPPAEYKSPTDFAAAYTSNVTFTLTNMPKAIVNDSQMVYLKVVPTGKTGSFFLVNGVDGVTFSYSAGVVTIDGAGTPLASGDDYEFGYNEQVKAYDSGLGANLVAEVAQVYDHYTAPESYTTFTPDDITYDEGTVIDVQSYNNLNFYYSKTASTADDSKIKVVYLITAASAVDHQETSIGSPAGGVTVIRENVYERDKAALVEMLPIPTMGAPFLRIDIAKKTDNGTDSTFTTWISKAYI